jgi:probable rRNA maturation factor
MILIDNRQDKIEITDELKHKIVKTIECALKEEMVNVKTEVSLIFVDNEEIRKLNSKFRNIDKSTDVLSFPMLEYPEGAVFKDVYSEYAFHDEDKDEENVILGDIVLSLEKAEEQSKEYGHSITREACYLTVHSVLHLLGYDHMNETEKSLMRKHEEDILTKLHLER